MVLVGVDRLVRLHRARGAGDRLAGVPVAVEAGEVAARDVDPDAVAGLEQVARRPQVDRKLVDAARLQGRRGRGRLAVAPAHDAVGEEARVARLVHVGEHGREVGVHGRGRSEQLQRQPAGRLHVTRQRGRREDEHVGTRAERPLVRGPGRDDVAAAEPAAEGRRGILGVVVVTLRRRLARKLLRQQSLLAARPGLQVVARGPGAGGRELRLVAPGVLPHHEHAHGGLRGELVGDALERVVHPAPQRVRRVQDGVASERDVPDLPFRRGRRVRPRPEQQPLPVAGLRSGRLRLQAEVVLDRTPQEQVVPAATVQRFHRHLGVMVGDLDLAPVVVARLVRDPVAEVGRDVGGRGQVEERVGRDRRRPLPIEETLLLPRLRLPPQRVDGEARRPGGGEPLHQRAVLVRPALVVLGGGDVGEDRDQVRGMGRRGQHLRGAHVRPAPHADLSVGVRQRGRPLHGVVSVLRLVPERIELALGVEAAPHVLPDHHVTGGGQAAGLPDAPFPVVGRSLEQRGVAAVGLGAIDVGHEGDAVARLHLYADLDLQAVGLGGAPGPGTRGSDRERHGAREDEADCDVHSFLPA